VYFYLRSLTAKYLTPVDRSKYLNDNLRLQSVQELRDKYAFATEINVLVLTGGGVRGLVPLRVLAQLETLTGKKTGELFDFMAGTSTGAISCAILSIPDEAGGFRYSAQQVCRTYIDNIRAMFKASWYHTALTLFGLLGPRYLPEGKLKVLQTYLGDYTLADLPKQLIVPVYDLNENCLQVVRNWEPRLRDKNTNFLLRDLIHGASNPPMLFSPRGFLVNKQKKIFIDPGVILNNPAEIALLNTWFLFPNKKIRIVLISNGGDDAEQYSHNHMAEFGAYGLFQYLLNSPIISTKFSTDLVKEYMQEAHDYGLDVDFVYINANGGQELGTSDTSHANMQRIEQFATNMISQNRQVIQELANKLSKKI
jgi:hypothetical protein